MTQKSVTVHYNCVYVCTEWELRRQAEELCVPISVLSVRIMMDSIKALQGDRDSAMIDPANRVCHIGHASYTSQSLYLYIITVQEILRY